MACRPCSPAHLLAQDGGGGALRLDGLEPRGRLDLAVQDELPHLGALPLDLRGRNRCVVILAISRSSGALLVILLHVPGATRCSHSMVVGATINL